MRRALLFDMFNTLVPGGDDGVRDRCSTRMAEVLGVDAAAFISHLTETWPLRSVGAMGELVDEIRTVAHRLGGSPSDDQVDVAATLRRDLTTELFAALAPTTVSVLDGLHAGGWVLGLVSNTASGTHEAFPASPLAACFQATGMSSELGVKKPDAGIYLAVCQRLGVTPAECVYVGDGADDELAAAAGLGMYAIRTTEHADTDPAWAGPTISHLTELPVQLSDRRLSDIRAGPGWMEGDLASGNVGHSGLQDRSPPNQAGRIAGR